MSLDIKAAVFAALSGDATVAALCGRRHDDADRPAVYPGSFADAEAQYRQAGDASEALIPFPVIVFRLSQQAGDGRFKPTSSEGGGPSRIGSVRLEVDVWAAQAGAAAYDDEPSARLCGAVVRLFDTATPRPITDGDGNPAGSIYYGERVSDNRDLPAPKLGARVSLLAFNLRVAQPGGAAL